MGPSGTAPRRLRDDIQGLRSLGALLVAVFHIWEHGVSGGVDVFFVVAGYFLATGFVRQQAAGGTVEIWGHWSRFLRRTVPEVLMVLCGTLLLALFFVSPFLWRDYLHDLAFSAVYLENYWLILSQQDYLARTETLSLVQHFWAVALIGQVNLLWPLLARGAQLYAMRAGRDAVRVLFALIAGLVVLSFAWSVVWTAANPTAAYFDFFTRFWQFGIGALLGLSPGLTGAVAGTRALVLSWLGLALVLSCGVAIGASAAFPGFASLWPVAAAALILLAGDPGQRGNAGTVLAWRPLAGLGGLAFGIYLWHWPLYVVTLAALEGERPSLLLGIAIIVVSIGLAAVSARLAVALTAAIGRLGRPQLVPVSSLAGLVLVAGLAATLSVSLLWNRVKAEPLIFMIGHHDLSPGPFSASDDIPESHLNGCNQLQVDAAVLSCTYGSATPSKRVVLVGGSHSLHWLPALRIIAEQENWQIVSMTKSSCLFADPSDAAFWKTEELTESCAQWNVDVMEEIMALRPDFVFSLASRKVTYPGTADLGERVPDAYVVVYQQLLDAGIGVVAIRDTPWLAEDVPACVYSFFNEEPNDCGQPRDSVLDDTAFAAEVRRLPEGVAVVDMSDTVCDAVHCDVVRDGRLMYSDDHHLTASYVRTLAPTLAARMNTSIRVAQLQRPHGS